MSLVVILVALVPLVAGVLAWRVWRHAGERAGRRAGALGAVARSTGRWRLAGLVVGLLAAVLVARAGGLGLGLLLAAPVFGLGVLGGVLVGEVTAAGPARVPTRRAAVEVRRARDYLPARLAGTVATLALALAGLLAVTSWTAAGDDLGRAGRSLRQVCPDGSVAGAGPWPGSFYSVPLALAVVAGLAVAAVVLHRIARRPWTGPGPGLRADDDRIRRQSAAAVTAACGVLVAVPLAGTALVAGAALRSLSCPPGWAVAAGWVLLGLAVASLGALGWFAATLLTPALAGRGHLEQAVSR